MKLRGQSHKKPLYTSFARRSSQCLVSLYGGSKIMNRMKVFAGLGAVAMSAVWAGQAGAQTTEVKEKPALYTYVADWNIPREKWGDMEKSYAGSQKLLDKCAADGTIVGYGSDVTLVHQGDG